MEVKELYERQYGEKKLISRNSFPRLRRMLQGLDVHREDMALNLLEGGDRFLDVGCGSGSLVFKASTRFQDVYGIDISEHRISEAEQQVAAMAADAEKFHFSCCDISRHIDFPDNTFDAATSIAVIEHVFDPYALLREVHRVVKPGGIFVAEVPNIAYLKQRIHLLLGKLPVTSSPDNWREIGWDGGHLHYFTKKTFCGLLEESGFRILEVTGCGLLARFRNFYPALLTGDICVKACKC